MYCLFHWSKNCRSLDRCNSVKKKSHNSLPRLFYIRTQSGKLKVLFHSENCTKTKPSMEPENFFFITQITIDLEIEISRCISRTRRRLAEIAKNLLSIDYRLIPSSRLKNHVERGESSFPIDNQARIARVSTTSRDRFANTSFIGVYFTSRQV